MTNTERIILQTQYEMLFDCMIELINNAKEFPNADKYNEAKRRFADRMVEVTLTQYNVLINRFQLMQHIL